MRRYLLPHTLFLTLLWDVRFPVFFSDVDKTFSNISKDQWRKVVLHPVTSLKSAVIKSPLKNNNLTLKLFNPASYVTGEQLLLQHCTSVSSTCCLTHLSCEFCSGFHCCRRWQHAVCLRSSPSSQSLKLGKLQNSVWSCRKPAAGYQTFNSSWVQSAASHKNCPVLKCDDGSGSASNDGNIQLCMETNVRFSWQIWSESWRERRIFPKPHQHLCASITLCIWFFLVVSIMFPSWFPSSELMQTKLYSNVETLVYVYLLTLTSISLSHFQSHLILFHLIFSTFTCCLYLSLSLPVFRFFSLISDCGSVGKFLKQHKTCELVKELLKDSVSVF